MSVAFVVVAAGRGVRLGRDVPKALVEVDGRPLLAHALERVMAVAPAEVVVVHPPGEEAATRAACVDVPDARLVPGGATRTASVAAGLAALSVEHDAVAVHDAARAFQPPAAMRRAVDAVLRDGAVAAAPALPVTDTVKQVEQLGPDDLDDSTGPGPARVRATPPRATLRAVQTPQVVAARALHVLVEAAETTSATDDLALVEAAVAAGQVTGDVVLVDGDPAGHKITWPEDLDALDPTTPHRVPVPHEAPERSASPAPRVRVPDQAPERGGRVTVRVGQGVDVHPFADEARPLVLGGHVVDPERGLAGHSDADVACHAVIDALLGAVGAGDIGQRFGVDRPETAGAASTTMLREVRDELVRGGWVLVNVDQTVLAQVPRLAPHRAAIRAGLADALDVDEGVVSVKFTTTDHLGFVGRAEGVACQAAVLVERSGTAGD